VRVDRSLLNWGVFLIALGGIPLAVDRGWLEPDVAQTLGRLWPLLLVGIGLGLMLRATPLAWFGGALVAVTFGLIGGAAAVTLRNDDLFSPQAIIPAVAVDTCAGAEPGAVSTEQGGAADAGAFELDVQLACGELQVSRRADASWHLTAEHGADAAPDIEASGEPTSRVAVDQRSPSGLVLLGDRQKTTWQVGLPAQAALTAQLTLEAARGTLDAGSGPIARLHGTLEAANGVFDMGSSLTPSPAVVSLELDASVADVRLPAGDIQASVDLELSSLRLCVPRSSPLRVQLNTNLSWNDLADAGLTEVTPGEWMAGTSAEGSGVSLSVNGNLAWISLTRPESCS
jgi:hypothetical protein